MNRRPFLRRWRSAWIVATVVSILLSLWGMTLSPVWADEVTGTATNLPSAADPAAQRRSPLPTGGPRMAAPGESSPSFLPPIAVAGSDQTNSMGAIVTLDGSGSFDPGGSHPLSFHWEVIAAPGWSTPNLEDPTSDHPTLTANFQGCYTIQLVVVNSLGISSAPDLVQLSVVYAESAVNSLVQVTFSPPHYDYVRQQTRATVALSNSSPLNLVWPLHLIITSITVPEVTVTNADGYTTNSQPYLDFSGLVENGVLEPGEASAAHPLLFANPQRLRFSFTWEVWARIQSPSVLPVLDPIGVVVMPEATVRALNLTASDADGDLVRLRAAGLPRFAQFIDLGWNQGRLLLQPGWADAGVYPVTIVAQDPSGLTDRETITITVQDVNRPPRILDLIPLVADEGVPYAGRVVAEDPDGDRLTYTLVQGPAGMGFIPNTNQITWPAPVAGAHQVIVRVEDGKGGSNQQAFVLNVGPPPPPFIQWLRLAEEDQTGVGQRGNTFFTTNDPIRIIGRLNRVAGLANLAALITLTGRNTGRVLVLPAPFNNTEFAAACDGRDEDEYTVNASVTAAGFQDQEQITVVVDRTPPEVVCTRPFRHTSGPLAFLYLAQADKEVVTDDDDPIQQRTKRNVYARERLALEGTVADALSGVADKGTVQVLQFETDGGELVYPFTNFSIGRAWFTNFTSANTNGAPRLERSFWPDGLEGELGRDFAVPGGFMTGLGGFDNDPEDSNEFDDDCDRFRDGVYSIYGELIQRTYRIYRKRSLYAVVVEAEDLAGNRGVQTLLAKVDRSAPRVNETEHGYTGLLRYLGADPDTYSLKMNGQSLAKPARGPVWYVSPQDFAFDANDDVNLTTATEDYAGNAAVRNALQRVGKVYICDGVSYHPYPTVQLLEYRAECWGEIAGWWNDHDEWWDSFGDCNVGHLRFGGFVELFSRIADDSDCDVGGLFTCSAGDLGCWWCGGGFPLLANIEVLLGRITTFEIDGHRASYFPRWDQVAELGPTNVHSRTATLTAQGQFPLAASVIAQGGKATLGAPSSGFDAPEGWEWWQAASWPSILSSYRVSGTNLVGASDSLISTTGEIQFSGTQLLPGWTSAFVAYGMATNSTQATGVTNEWIDEDGTHNHEEHHTSVCEGKETYGYFRAERLFHMLKLTPDTVGSGQRVTMRLQGGFPNDLTSGEVTVAFSASGHGNPAPQVVRSSYTNAEGIVLQLPLYRVIEEDPFNATVWRTIEFDVAVPGNPDGLASALGPYQVNVSASAEQGGVADLEMLEALRVVVVDLDICKPKVIDPAEVPIADEDELRIGSQTFVNLDNDDQGEDTAHYFDLDIADSDVPGEDDMVKLVLRLTPADLRGRARVVCREGASTIKLWRFAHKGEDYVPGSALAVPGDFTMAGDSLVKELWVEGLAPHFAQRGAKLQLIFDDAPASPDEVALTVLGIHRIEWIGRNNSVEDTDVLDPDPNWPPDLAPGALRVFPDSRLRDGGIEWFPRWLLDVKVTLTAPPLEPLKLYFRSFDVDDPTAAADPVDDEANDEDNRGNVPAAAGKFADEVDGIKEQVFDAQQEMIEFQVTMQPGDNFRIVGNGDKDFLADLENHDATLHSADASEAERRANKQRIVNRHVAGYPANREILEREHYASPVLTVWRFLHLERDSYTAPISGETFSGAGIGDDDVDPGDLGNSDITLMPTVYRRAYMVPVDDLAALNRRPEVAFVRNLPDGDANRQGETVRDVRSTQGFWVVQILAAYEPGVLDDYDPDDPNRDAVAGFAPGPCLIYHEVIRDLAANDPDPRRVSATVLEQRVVVHETMHRFDLQHGKGYDTGIFYAGTTLVGTDDENQFHDKHLDHIRRQPRPTP